MHYIETLPNFMLFYVLSFAVVAIFALIYMYITPYNEIREIRENHNTAAAIALSGNIIGFSLPVASLLIHAVNVYDFLIWTSIACTAQILTFLLLTLLIKDIKNSINNQYTSVGIMIASMSIVTGIINAACLSY